MKVLQAKSISDGHIKEAVGNGATRSEVCARFIELPTKIVNSKLRQAVRKGILSGCSLDTCARRNACLNGCDGMYRVVSK